MEAFVLAAPMQPRAFHTSSQVQKSGLGARPFHLTTARDSVRRDASLVMTTNLVAGVAHPRCLKVVVAASTASSLNGPGC